MLKPKEKIKCPEGGFHEPLQSFLSDHYLDWYCGKCKLYSQFWKEDPNKNQKYE